MADPPAVDPNAAPAQGAQNGGGDAGALEAQAQGNGQPPQAPDANQADANQADATQPGAATNDGVGGMSALRGLVVYGAVLTFAGLFAYFMVLIATAKRGVAPSIDSAMIGAAAALAGVLGSAFALKIGVSPDPSHVNTELADHVKAAKAGDRARTGAFIHKALSLEPSDVNSKSWPLTFGIWAYAGVAAATAVIYVLNERETPQSVKALAVAFGGYVLALLNMAYGLNRSKPNSNQASDT